MNPRTKNILIVSGVIVGSALLGLLIYALSGGSSKKKLEDAAQKDKEMDDLLKKIDRAKK